MDENKSLLVVAGAGSGKTLTIIGKIKYLIEKKGYNEKDILCISFTNETVINLKNRVGYNIDCFTFHKLSLTILKDFNYQYYISQEDYLSYIVNEYFYSYIYSDNYIIYVEEYFERMFSKKIDYDGIINTYYKEFSIFINSIVGFIKKIKTNNHHVDNFKNYFYVNNDFQEKESNICFLVLALRILFIYQEELMSTLSVDFDDMLSIATSLVREKGIKRNYKYIIIDEFQDTSWIRYLLIKSILEKTQAKIMCVGDDYQSIYGFSGCNLDLFVNFSKYFVNSKIRYIKNTYRNSYQIINTSTSFIKKNPYQLSKKLHANLYIKNPIKVIYYNNNYTNLFFKLLDYLYNQNQRDILILGRYNRDLSIVLNGRDFIYKDMKLEFLTVHCSKGLERENVIILNMSDNYLGFPSKIEDNKIYSLISNKEKYMYAEERRLFYVALTRTKNYVYILAPKNNPSCFIKEIKYEVLKL